MALTEKSFEEILFEKGITGSYVWRSNQVYVKDPSDPSHYDSIDVIGGDIIADVTSAAQAEAETQIARINESGNNAVSSIENYSSAYSQIKDVALTAFGALSDYFRTHGMPVPKAIVDTAIEQINSINEEEQP